MHTPSQSLREIDGFETKRLEQREALLKKGIDPYPARVNHRVYIRQAIGHKREKQNITIAGRVLKVSPKRRLLVEDITESIEVDASNVNNEAGRLILNLLEHGDWISIKGFIRKIAGTPLLVAHELNIICKAICRLPNPQNWVKDKDAQRRCRSVDLAVRPQARDLFKTRIKLIRNVRQYLWNLGLDEIETPVLRSWFDLVGFDQFETTDVRGNPLYLRLCHEDRIKQLVSGGFEKLFEIGKSFRRDNVSPTHIPEFLQLETIQAFTDYQVMMEQAEDMFRSVTERTIGCTTFFGHRSGEEIDLAKPWCRIRVRDAIIKWGGFDIDQMDANSLANELTHQKVQLPKNAYKTWKWSLVAEAIDAFVVPHLSQPTILYDYPAGSNWLVKRVAERPSEIERFEFYIDTVEMGNCYSLNNDPVDFAERFSAGVEECRALDLGERPIDMGLLAAKAYGLPPFSESSFGLERWLMLITEQEDLSDVVWMPYPYI